ncbi:MAG: inositol-pentakisphosphate 2-kinase [Benjaminiella poitrasii]|nr:MAG: inositol-pentakisphosphate 2-kinase [Benjaminiella poitrasii]
MIYPALHTAENWEYVGEGNQNIVVRYTGDNTVYKRKVLRIVKCDEKESKNPTKNDLLFKQQFIEKIIRNLVGHEYILLMEPVTTSLAFLHQLEKNIEHARPVSRLKKKIMTNACISFLMDDLTQLWPDSPSLTIELKPKWGFKPSSQFITSDVKKKYCRFCIHSHLRENAIKDYCPLDLYSGDPIRVKKALCTLLKHVPKTKNLKITFAHGANEQPSNFKSTLLHNANNGDFAIIEEILEKILLKDPILSRLKALQTSLDELDVEGILPLYNCLSLSGALETQDIRIWEDVVSNYLQRQNGVTINDDSQRIYEYLLSMTFKDCSIMINIASASNTNNSDNSENSVTLSRKGYPIFKYDVKVVDTDLKSIDKIPHWYNLDQSIVKNAIDTNFKKEECINQ